MRKSCLLIALLMLAAACGGGDDSPRPGRPPAAQEPPKPKFCPLTGKEAPKDLEAERPALAVKLDNSAPGRPQAGLESADIVYEELAEGGITRFLAIFHCGEASSLGPVRSSRMVDPDILQEYVPDDGGGVLFAYSGAAGPVLKKVQATEGIADIRHDTHGGAYRRETGRRSPLNLFSSTETLRDLPDAKGVKGPPEIGLTFEQASPSPASGAKSPSPAAGTGAASPAPPAPPPGNAAQFSFGAGAGSKYTYDAASGAYLRFHGETPHKTNDGQQVKAVNVLFLKVQIVPGQIRDKAGNASPEITVTGSGEAIVLKGGQSVTGKWTRNSLSDKTKLTDASGTEIKLAPGNTWIHLLPANRPVTLQ